MSTVNLFYGSSQDAMKGTLEMLQCIPLELMPRVELRTLTNGWRHPRVDSREWKAMSTVFLIQPPQDVIDDAEAIDPTLENEIRGVRSIVGCMSPVIAEACVENGWRVEHVYLKSGIGAAASRPTDEEVELITEVWAKNNDFKLCCWLRYLRYIMDLDHWMPRLVELLEMDNMLRGPGDRIWNPNGPFAATDELLEIVSP